MSDRSARAIGGRSVADRYPVVVVGAGPTGLTLANLLSRYGTRALLVERNATTVQEPRAVSIDDESLRTMQSAGVIDRVLPDIVAGYGSDYRSPAGRTFLKVEPTAQPYGYPRRNAFRQPLLEARLREALLPSATVDAVFGWSLDRFEQDADGVTVHLSDADGSRHTVACDYLVGADGARSPVRGALGLTLDGETFEEKWLIVDLERSPAPGRDTVVFCDARRPCIALPGPEGTRRFEFKLMPGEHSEDMVRADRVWTLLADHGAHPDSVVRRSVVYTFHARLAPRWSSGRVFLAGDACHLTPPFAGQGMNSGIRDAHNLAWKLAWVTSGRLAPGLLATYEVERRDHVRDMITLALRMGRIMGPRNRLVGLATRTAFRALGVWPGARDYFAQMKYKPKPRIAAGFVADDGTSARSTMVGRLFPQFRVRRSDGRPMLLDDVLGDGFAIVGVNAGAGDLARIAARRPFAALRPAVVSIVADGAADRSEEGVETVVDTVGGLVDDHGAATRVFLVRPDRYVIAVLDDTEASAAAVERVIGSF